MTPSSAPLPPTDDDPAMDHPDTRPLHLGIIRTAIAATAVHFIVTVTGVLSDASTVRNAVALVSVVLFFAGSLAFMAAFVVAAGRSRYEEVWFGGAFFLTGGVTPVRARSILMACLAVQCIVGLGGASLAPFTPVAFSVLVPMSALGLMSFYGSRWGEFSPKAEDD